MVFWRLSEKTRTPRPHYWFIIVSWIWQYMDKGPFTNYVDRIFAPTRPSSLSWQLYYIRLCLNNPISLLVNLGGSHKPCGRILRHFWPLPSSWTYVIWTFDNPHPSMSTYSLWMPLMISSADIWIPRPSPYSLWMAPQAFNPIFNWLCYWLSLF